MWIDLPDRAGQRGEAEVVATEAPEPGGQGPTRRPPEALADDLLQQTETLSRLSSRSPRAR